MKTGRVEQRVQAALRCEAQGDLVRAEREYRAALEISPRHLGALNNLGFLYAARGRFEPAAQLFRRAVLADPADAQAQLNLAGALREMGEEAAALEGLARLLTRDPGLAAARLNLANLLRSQGRLDEARPHYQRLLRDDPGNGQARWNLAALEGLAGDHAAAFAGFAQHHALQPAAPPPALPRWRGEPLAGRRILIEADQGLGDSLMFCRYVGRVRDLGGRVILRAQPELAPLLATLDGVEQLAGRDRTPPRADLWFPLVDLPTVLGAAPEPLAAPYLTPPPDRLAALGPLAPDRPGLRVGLVWAGNPAHPDDRNRSASLGELAPLLAATPDVEWVSLQVGPRAGEGAQHGLAPADLQLKDFADTAAALARLDLLISVDTAVLHLAGALGRPAWALLPFAPDWRWMLGRADSPWYPSLRLYRQSRPRDWSELARRIADDLRALARKAG